MSTPFESYRDTYPPEVRTRLDQMRQAILEVIPNATETISYGIPTFDLYGTHVVHVGAFKQHIGFFPTSSPIPVFAEKLKGYTVSKGAIQFPFDHPLPLDLVREITRYRLREIAAKVHNPEKKQ